MSQTGQNVLVAYKVEATFDTAPGATGAEQLRLNASPGLALSRPTILPGEIRPDLLSPMGRLGSRAVGGSYSGDLSVNSFDSIFEALMRGTWTAAVALTSSEMTSITTTTSEITAAGGSWITEGVRVGDLVRLTGCTTTANNNVNLMVAGVTASVITLQGTPLTLDASPDVGFTLTILKKLINPATPTRRSFYIQEDYTDIDVDAVFGGCRWDGFTITGSPDGMATIDLAVVGASVNALASGASPYYTSPTQYSSDGLTFVDAQIRLGGTALLTATAFSLQMNLGMQTLPVIGATSTPDVFDGTCVMSGSISILRDDLSKLTAFDAETEFELHILLEEATGTPLPALSFFLPRIKLTGVNAPIGQAGGMIETLPFMVGVKAAASGYDATMMSICTET